MGVGADVAFNDHVENGNWADLEYNKENKIKGNNWRIKILKVVKNELKIIKKYIVKGNNIE